MRDNENLQNLSTDVVQNYSIWKNTLKALFGSIAEWPKNKGATQNSGKAGKVGWGKCGSGVGGGVT